MKRLTTSERGYGAAHRKEREKYRKAVGAGAEYCRRCARWIPPGGFGACPRCGKDHRGWDLGHLDGSGKTVWTGPEHVCCNRATAGRRAWRRVVPVRPAEHLLTRISREW